MRIPALCHLRSCSDHCKALQNDFKKYDFHLGNALARQTIEYCGANEAYIYHARS